jgi:PAS domain S-box-containing protein/putative nucleotidyltransferase with HDIG domain
MNDPSKTNQDLIEENALLKQRIQKMEISEADHKQVEENLRASELKYQTIFETTGTTMLIVEEDMTISLANDKWRCLTGYTREEVEGKRKWTEFIEKGDLEEMFTQHRLRKTDPGFAKKNYEFRLVHRDGCLKNIILTVDIIPGTKKSVASLIDITDRKQAEVNLLKAEENYRGIFENAQEGIYRTTPDGRFIMANNAMARILGYDSPEDLMTCVTDITHQLYVNPKERTKIIELIERQGFARTDELQFCRKDGRTIWVYMTMRAVRDESGQLLYFEGLVEDITNRKESVDHLRKALGGVVQAIASLVETKDPYTAGHQRRVADLARSIAREMGLSDEQINGIRMAAIIHDIGKVSVPTELLSMPRKLTNLEFNLIKTHAQSGYDILKDIEFPWPIARMVLEHHERMNESGYPNALIDEDILLESRILAVADVVEAIATHRPYRSALGIDAALEEITKNKGILYDADAVDACLRLFNEKGYKIKE